VLESEVALAKHVSEEEAAKILDETLAQDVAAA
jgi:RNA polymerase-interacting CarD/CdnL/TRCF family regulator